MEEIFDIIQTTRGFATHSEYGAGEFRISYKDPGGDVTKRNLIEELMDRTLDEAKKIIES